MSEVKVAWVISNIDRWQPFEWVAKSLKDKGIHVDYYFLAREQGYFYSFIKSLGLEIKWLPFSSKRNYPHLIYTLSKHFKKQKYDVVHCHFVDASVCGLTAAYLSGTPKRIYTRHHSTFHHVYAPKGVYLDKTCNYLSTKIVAISNTVKDILVTREDVNPIKIEVIHHGFDFDTIQNISEERIMHIASKYDLTGELVIGVVSRFIEWKGIQYIIPAFKEFLKNNKDVILVLANARGNYEDRIKILLKDIPAENYRFIPFERDIYALFHNFNIFIHVPINPDIEAFGQIYIEALAASVPSIFTLSGIAHDFIINERNALIVPYCDSNAIYEAISRLLKDENKSEDLRQNGRKDISQLFGLKKMVDQLTNLYSN